MARHVGNGRRMADGGARERGVAAQILCVLTGIGLLAGWPAAGGTVLLLPTTARLADTINLALAHHARIAGAGPVPGSVVVVQGLTSLAGPMLRQGTLVVGIPRALCGAVPLPTKASAQ